MTVDYARRRQKPGSLPVFRTLDDLPHLLTPQQLAEYLGVAEELVYEGLRAGTLPGVYPGPRKLVITREMVRAWERRIGERAAERATRDEDDE